MRQLQIQNGHVVAEWSGSADRFPVPPDASWTFVDATDRPSARCGDTYDKITDTFAPPAPVSAVLDPDDPREALKEVRTQLAVIKGQLDGIAGVK